MKADEKHAHELDDAQWREIVGKIKGGERIVAASPAKPELPDARTMSDAEFNAAMDRINTGRPVK